MLGDTTEKFSEAAAIMVDSVSELGNYNKSARNLCRALSAIVINMKIWIPHTFSGEQEESLEKSIKRFYEVENEFLRLIIPKRAEIITTQHRFVLSQKFSSELLMHIDYMI